MPRIIDVIWVLFGIGVLYNSVKDNDIFNIIICGFLLIFGIAEIFRNRHKNSNKLNK